MEMNKVLGSIIAISAAVILVVFAIVILLWFIGLIISYFQSRNNSISKFLDDLLQPASVTARTSNRVVRRKAANDARLAAGGRVFYTPTNTSSDPSDDDIIV